MAPQFNAPPSYSTAEVARRLGVSTPTVQRWVDQGFLRAWKTLGGHRRIDARSADEFIARQSVGGAAPAAVTDRGGGGRPLSVLVVDDNPDDRDVIATLVGIVWPGAAISLAGNGFDALLSIGQSVPDLLITDLVMPHIDGIEMLRRLSERAELRPRGLLAVSSKSARQIARLGALPPGVVFLPKPLDAPRLQAAVRSALGSSLTTTA